VRLEFKLVLVLQFRLVLELSARGCEQFVASGGHRRHDQRCRLDLCGADLSAVEFDPEVEGVD
jgi:hypothetical protein